MTPDLWTRLEDLVPEALERSGSDRETFLARSCRTPSGDPDPELRAEVEALIRAAEAADATGVLLSPVAGATGSVARDEHIARHRLPERIGPWTISGLLGEGGMGIVYRAHRSDGAFDREVAIKRLRPGLGPELAERLHAESRILASLDHPAIARLYDSGTADDGAPYLVVEYVPGETVTAYADRQGLGTRARARLGLAVAEAVAYAHQHLIIHRDVKPSNVLVVSGGSEQGAGGRRHGETSSPMPPTSSLQVKLLDFGLAKLIDASNAPLLTVHGMMTPAYAAPEQFHGGPVTTATDVYALGVLLYELLAGQRPYDLASASPAEAERIVCSTDPPLPSSVAPLNRARALRGDLDRIVLHAMANAPEKRYDAAQGLARDLRRYLDGQPVEARTQALGYLLSRFVRRYRAAVAGALGLVLGLAALLAAYTVGLQEERDRALAAEAEAADQAGRAEATADFLEDILRAPNPLWYVDAEAKGPDTPIRAVLDEAAARVERDFADRPDLRADLRHILGDTYLALGLEEEAREHHRAVLSIRERLYAPPHPALAEALYYAGGVAPTVAEKVRLYEEAAEMLRQRPGGNNLPFILTSLARHYLDAGRPDLAEPLARESRAVVSAAFTPGTDGFRYRELLLRYTAELAVEALLAQGSPDDARPWLRLFTLPHLKGEACTLGQWHLVQNDPTRAEASLQDCWATAPGDLRDDAGAYLVALYDRAGMPERAAPYRDAAARHHARRDSIEQGLAPLLAARD